MNKFKFELGDFVTHAGSPTVSADYGVRAVIIARWIEERKGGNTEMYKISIGGRGLHLMTQPISAEEIRKA